MTTIPSKRNAEGNSRTGKILILVNVIGLLLILSVQMGDTQIAHTVTLPITATAPTTAATAATTSGVRGGGGEHVSRATAVAEQPAPEKQKTFTEILIKSKSDKYYRHHYERYYTRWLEPYRNKPGVKLLEIGAEKGRSLKLWQDYFTNPASIVGLAYGHGTQRIDKVAAALSKIEVVRGDQSSEETMDLLAGKGPWDVIIDDGSHVPDHMVFSFFRLWNSVKPGGMFIIEDVETNYWKPPAGIYGYKFNAGISKGPKVNAVAKYKQFIDVLNRYQIGARELSIMDGDVDICSVEFGMNVLAFYKCSEENIKATPKMQPPNFDAEEMKDWIMRAKESNPKPKA